MTTGRGQPVASGRILGRERELALLARFAPPPSRGEGMRQAFVVGDPGIGTSALLAAYAAACRERGVRVHLLDGRTGDVPPPLAGLVEAGRAPDPELVRARLVSALEQAVVDAAADGAGTVTIVDHGDALGGPAQLVLDSLAALDPALGLTLVVAVRAGMLPGEGDAPWAATTARIAARMPTPEVVLAPLADHDIEEIVAGSARMLPASARAEVVRAAGGNPWVAEELARGAHGGRVPRPVGEWVEVMLAELGHELGDALRTMALADAGVPIAALGTDGEALVGIPFVSTHERDGEAWAALEVPAVRDAVAGATPVSLRRVLAREAVERIAAVVGTALPTTPPALDATGFPASAGLELHPALGTAAAELLAVCGDMAGADAVHSAVARAHELARRPLAACAARRAALEPAAHELESRIRSLRDAAHTFRDINDAAGTGRLLRALEEVARRAGDLESVAYAVHERYFVEGLVDEAMLHRVLDECDDTVGWGWRIRAWLAYAAGDQVASAAADRRALEIAAARGDVVLELLASEKLALALEATGHPAEGMELLSRVIDRCERVSFWRRYFMASLNLVSMLENSGRIVEAVERAQAAFELARVGGRSGQVVEMGTTLAYAAACAGRIPLATEAYESAVAASDPHTLTALGERFLATVAVRVALDAGNVALARSRADALEQSHSGLGDAFLDAFAWVLIGRVAAEDGDVPRILRACSHLAGGPAELVSELAAVTARAATVKPSSELLAAAAGLAGQVTASGPGSVVRLYLDEVTLHVDGAVGDASRRETMVGRWRDAGYETEALELQACHAQSVARGADAGALDAGWLRDQRRRCRSAGAALLEGRFNRLLRDRGERAPASSRARGDRLLTEREEQVVQLVRTGMSNADIAADLGIASATVARLLANVYRRLGVSGRTALLAYLDEHA